MKGQRGNISDKIGESGRNTHIEENNEFNFTNAKFVVLAEYSIRNYLIGSLNSKERWDMRKRFGSHSQR